MSTTAPTDEPAHSPLTTRRARGGALVLLVSAVVLGGLAATVSYGFAIEYADTEASALDVAWWSLRAWAPGLLLVAATALGARALARTRPVRVLALAVLVVTVLGVGGGAVLGAGEKYARYPDVPDCTGELTAGPALAVTRAAQRSFEEIDHPAPFSGGGSSGVDGCSSELMMRDAEDPHRHYRSALPDAGWGVVGDTDARLRAEKDDQAFELTRGKAGWEVWIGPRELERPAFPDGEVGVGG